MNDALILVLEALGRVVVEALPDLEDCAVTRVWASAIALGRKYSWRLTPSGIQTKLAVRPHSDMFTLNEPTASDVPIGVA